MSAPASPAPALPPVISAPKAVSNAPVTLHAPTGNTQIKASNTKAASDAAPVTLHAPTGNTQIKASNTKAASNAAPVTLEAPTGNTQIKASNTKAASNEAPVTLHAPIGNTQIKASNTKAASNAASNAAPVTLHAPIGNTQIKAANTAGTPVESPASIDEVEDPAEKPEKGFAYVSQTPFWQGVNDANNNNNNDNGGPKAVYLSYDLFLGLSVLGGFFALDHLYLRSPLTFLAKFFMNIMFFGIWWLYDALQAVFHGEVVQAYGLGIPGLGPKGIAGGVLSKEVPDKKHLNFFIYAIALMLGGIFGADSFLVGDKQSGFIRMIMLVSVILAPCAIIWWGYNIFRFFFNTKGLISENGNYFGVPQTSAFSKMFPWLSALNPLEWITNFLQNIFGPPIGALKESLNATTVAIQGATKVAGEGIGMIGTVATAIPETIKQISSLGTASPGKSMLDAALSGAAPSAGPDLAAVQSAAEQKGGSQESGLNILPYTLLGTVAAIAAAGFGTTYYRSKNVASPQRDDTPPEPGVLRKPHQKGRAA